MKKHLPIYCLIQYNQTSNGTEIYRRAHGCSYAVISDRFGISQTLAIEAFNRVIKEFIAHFYNDYVNMLDNKDEWQEKLTGFIENYEFPCVVEWCSFHFYKRSNLKNVKFRNTQLKRQYSVSNMALVGYNKQFVDLVVGSTDSTHDDRFFRHVGLF